MEYIFNTRLRGNIALTDSYHTNLALQKDNTLYKFIWVQSGSLQLEIDHVPTTLVKGEIIPLTPLHHIEFKAINGEYLTLLFNSNFYCIFETVGRNLSPCRQSLEYSVSEKIVEK